MSCDCKDWEKNIGCNVRGFKYCPYCRKSLIEDEYKEKPNELVKWVKTSTSDRVKVVMDNYYILNDYVKRKYYEPVFYNKFQSPCDGCQNNPQVNPSASGFCCCALPAMMNGPR